ncbi:MAG TPA: hypothetical protein VFV38_01160 [Ktedonobacteraceae bacterium]|nr:hypothetical protein [Ktedonobacteraceae bacterium]
MSTKRWNIFARELEDILNRRDCRLGQLDDRAGIHPQKVSRLQKSLRQPKHFQVLDPEELEDVVLAFDLDQYEELCLRAAVLTVAIEGVLIKRIDPEDALLAAEQIFPIILRVLDRHKSGGSGLANVRGDS